MPVIELTTTPFGYPIAFDTTGIVVKATTKDRDTARAVVNDVPVLENFNEIMFKLSRLYQ